MYFQHTFLEWIWKDNFEYKDEDDTILIVKYRTPWIVGIDIIIYLHRYKNIVFWVWSD